MVQFNPLVVGWPFNQSNKGVWASHFSLLLGMGGLLILFCFLFFSLSWGPSVALLVSSTFPIPPWVFLSLSPTTLWIFTSLPTLSFSVCLNLFLSLSSHLSVCLSSSSQSLSLVTLFLQPTVNLSLCITISLSPLNLSLPLHISPLPLCPFASLLWPLFGPWSLAGPYSVRILQVQGQFQSTSTGLPHIVSSGSHLWVPNGSYQRCRQHLTSSRDKLFVLICGGEKGEERTKGK